MSEEGILDSWINALSTVDTVNGCNLTTLTLWPVDLYDEMRILKTSEGWGWASLTDLENYTDGYRAKITQTLG